MSKMFKRKVNNIANSIMMSVFDDIPENTITFVIKKMEISTTKIRRRKKKRRGKTSWNAKKIIAAMDLSNMQKGGLRKNLEEYSLKNIMENTEFEDQGPGRGHQFRPQKSTKSDHFRILRIWVRGENHGRLLSNGKRRHQRPGCSIALLFSLLVLLCCWQGPAHCRIKMYLPISGVHFCPGPNKTEGVSSDFLQRKIRKKRVDIHPNFVGFSGVVGMLSIYNNNLSVFSEYSVNHACYIGLYWVLVMIWNSTLIWVTIWSWWSFGNWSGFGHGCRFRIGCELGFEFGFIFGFVLGHRFHLNWRWSGLDLELNFILNLDLCSIWVLIEAWIWIWICLCIWVGIWIEIWIWVQIWASILMGI